MGHRGAEAQAHRGIATPGALEPGTVVLARISFDGTEAEKTRPAVVIWCHDDELALLAISSSPFYPSLPISDWIGAGLAKPCGVTDRCVRLGRSGAVLGVVGTLDKGDWRRVLSWSDGIPTASAA